MANNTTLAQETYFLWLTHETQTRLWHDSGVPKELDEGLALGATGVTTNPVLSYQALATDLDFRSQMARSVHPDMAPDDKAEALVKGVVTNAAAMFEGIFDRSGGAEGFVCGQVNPMKASDTNAMVAMARRIHSWAPNICVKIPATAAGLDVLEECVAEGISVNATVSFTVSQAVAVAQRCKRGIKCAKANGRTPRPTFCTIMIGRQDDYVREIAQDTKTDLSEDDVRQAGLAVVKRAYNIYKEQGYDTVLVIAALRGANHMSELVGAEVVISVHPKVQAILKASSMPIEERIEIPVAGDVIRRLETVPEFVRAYEPNGMKPEEFLSYGLTQRTISQFCEAGWLALRSLNLKQE